MTMKEAIEDHFARLAARASIATASFWAFAAALFAIVVWAGLGPVFGFSAAWQLVVNTAATIVTFLMVFVIQHAQNKEMRAMQSKLSELIAAGDGASNRHIDVEDVSERELEHLFGRYQRLAATATKLTLVARTSVDDESDATPAFVRGTD